jgi:hypothetical protein
MAEEIYVTSFTPDEVDVLRKLIAREQASQPAPATPATPSEPGEADGMSIPERIALWKQTNFTIRESEIAEQAERDKAALAEQAAIRIAKFGA